MKLPEKIQFRPRGCREIIALRCADGSQASEVARAMAIRYAAVMRESLPLFAAHEWLVIVTALRQISDVDSVRAELVRAIKLHGAGAELSIDSAVSLLARIEALSYAELAATLDFSDMHWTADARGERPELPGA